METKDLEIAEEILNKNYVKKGGRWYDFENDKIYAKIGITPFVTYYVEFCVNGVYIKCDKIEDLKTLAIYLH